ncbi:23S rRNA (guanosine(2251)-2'-O)-methyltransferase RlmB, partial [Enterococcus faecium]
MGKERTNKHQSKRGFEDKKQNRYSNKKQTGRNQSVSDQNEEALEDNFVFGHHAAVE